METLNPLDGTAGPFLSLYVLLACGALLLPVIWGNRLVEPASAGPADARGTGLVSCT